mgnify:CR=1 FL=1
MSPVFATDSKPGYGPALGAEGLAALVSDALLPVYALGGIRADTVAACLTAGAAGVAVMGAVMGAEDPAAALRAGKHVFCEKPLATDADGLADVLAAAAQTDAILTVGFNRRYAPMLQWARAALSTRTGPVVMLYRINAGAIAADSWVQRDEGGGRIVGEVCHFVDTLIFLAGSLPVEAHAICARGHEDAVSILLRFADGSTGTIVYTALGDPGVAKEYIEIFATGRVIQIDDFARLSITSGGKTVASKGVQDKGQTALVAAFVDAVRGKCGPPIALAELAATTQATFAIEESLRIGAPVALTTA